MSRTPHPDPLVRGAFVGLTVRHSLAHCTRAVLEGVAFGLKDYFELMRSIGLAKVDQVRISGGGAHLALWRQILADVFDMEIVTINTTEGAAYGAALLASVGAGEHHDVESACQTTIHATGSISPSKERVDAYQQIYPLYQELYPALKPSFLKMG